MNTLSPAEIFFIISSVGFVLLWTFLAVLILYIIRAVRTFNRITDKLEKSIDDIGDTTKELIEDVQDSAVFRFLFKRKSNRHKNLK